MGCLWATEAMVHKECGRRRAGSADRLAELARWGGFGYGEPIHRFSDSRPSIARTGRGCAGGPTPQFTAGTIRLSGRANSALP